MSDSFTFVKDVRNFTFSPSSVFLCSFDISSLFTNVPLVETIQLCADALHNNNVLPQPSFPRDIFVELMQLATSSVEFSFNNNMYRQIDGVAMGSPLGPALANIFIGYQEEKLFLVADENEKVLDVLVERLGSEFNISLQETYLHWSVSTLEFL